MFGEGGVRKLSSALRVCSKSLKTVALSRNEIGDEQLREIIEALSTHSQLKSMILRMRTSGEADAQHWQTFCPKHLSCALLISKTMTLMMKE